MPVFTLNDTVVAFGECCHEDGFDIVHPFSVAAYETSTGRRLSAVGRRDPLGLIVGNTRHLWDVLRRVTARDPSWLRAENPIDDYTEARIGAAAALLEADTRISYVHVLDPAPVAVQRIAQATGLTVTSPSHLSLHPTFGPWLGFRAVVVVDVDAPPLPVTQAPNPCAACTRPCLPALDLALAATEQAATVASMGPAWPLWAKVRDVCPEGKGHRYDDDQIRYHYAKDRDVLEALRALPSQKDLTERR